MDVQIIGAGFSGLTLAYYLNQRGLKAVLFEKNKEVGGVLQTKSYKSGRAETAANGLIETPLVKQLFLDLNIPQTFAKKESAKRYLYVNNRYSRWPLSFKGSIKFIFGLIKTLFKLNPPQREQTVTEWASTQFGEEAATSLISPALQGIYGEDGNKLDSQLIFSRFYKKKIKREMKSSNKLTSPQEGMGQLMKHLTSHLEQSGHQIKTNQKLQLNQLDSTKPIVIATSLNDAKNIIPHYFDHYQLETLNLSSITLFTHTPLPVDGFGILFKRNENINALGVLNNPAIFDHRVNDAYSSTWILKNQTELSDEAILDTIKKDYHIIFADELNILEYSINHWPGVLPKYDNKLNNFCQEYNNKQATHLFLTGNYLGKLGLTGILEYNCELAEKIELTLKGSSNER